ncbi:3-oxoacyl-[acyl-carrier-protein] reductase [Xylanivirga thermophila]|uniref:3-oxoacyl-[acyl-carrier-protein] reductase n=1 Tax=Xylanivirga thermophila TaxID=2496273 RepID=UPI00101E0D98|nr:3-oxoacyl-[acyl-carrier-protein] reductase [Xylanivirga thermophila]
MSIEDKIALVTGASRGIGKATAIYLADLGANVAINYSSDEQGAMSVVEEIRKHGRKSKAFKANVSCMEDVQAMMDEIRQEFGGLDILVNNAGITKDALLVRMKPEDWEKVIDVNLNGVFNCTKSAARIMMRQRRGNIINISSVIGLTGNAGQANYAAAKAGIIGFSKSIAKELASRGIRVNVVAPGFIQTDMTGMLPQNIKEELLSKIPLGRYGDPMDIAHLVGFLASDESSYITGQVINVDGGILI